MSTINGVVVLVWRKGVGVGAVIMLGTLLGLIIVIFGLVCYFDPEARRRSGQETTS